MKLSKHFQRLLNIAIAVFFMGSLITYYVFFSSPDYPEISKEQLIEYLENGQVQQTVLVLEEEGNAHGTLEISLCEEALPKDFERASSGIFHGMREAHYALPVQDISRFRQEIFNEFEDRGLSSGFDYSIEIRDTGLSFRLVMASVFFLIFFFSYIFPILLGGFILYIGINYLQNQRKTSKRVDAPARQEKVKISVRSADRILLLPLEEIAAFYARHNYVYAYHQNGTEYLVEQTLTQLQEKLPNHFIRVHRSSIVNVHYVQSIDKEKGGKYKITLNDLKSKHIHVSQSYGHTVRDMTVL